MLSLAVYLSLLGTATGSCNTASCNADDVTSLMQLKKGEVKKGGANAAGYLSLAEIDRIKDTFVATDTQASFLETSRDDQTCFHAGAWLEKFSKEPSWKVYSQGDQDAVLASLFSKEHVGTTNKEFVEFGFFDHNMSTSFGNGHHLQESLGFHNFLLLDGATENPDINLHKRFITDKSIVPIFDEFQVPNAVDFMSIDIDSCDLWVFRAITEKYKPRVMTVEYNSNYAFDDYHTLKCADPKAKNAYLWEGDNIYGTSLSAIELAAQQHGYSMVYVSPQLDAFMVRNDLLCPGSAIPKERFRATTSLPLHSPYNGKYGPKSELLLDFKLWSEQQAAIPVVPVILPATLPAGAPVSLLQRSASAATAQAQAQQQSLALSGKFADLAKAIVGDSSVTKQLLQTFKVCGQCGSFARWGEAYDGGYLMCMDGLKKGSVMAAYSLGVEHHDQWSEDVASNLGVKVHQFDCTVDGSATCSTCQFHKKCIVAADGKHPVPGHESEGWSLAQALTETGHADAPDNSLLMKMDIEGSEWAVYAAEPPEALKKFGELIMEFHNLEDEKRHPEYLQAMTHLLAAGFKVVHLHGNNFSNMYSTGATTIPNVVEVTFVHGDARPDGCLADQDYNMLDARNFEARVELPMAHIEAA